MVSRTSRGGTFVPLGGKLGITQCRLEKNQCHSLGQRDGFRLYRQTVHITVMEEEIFGRQNMEIGNHEHVFRRSIHKS